MNKKRNMLLPLVAALSLSACGGGGGDSAGSASLNGTSGKAVDGYLSGATVFCDSNQDGRLNAGEMSTVTDAGGNYHFGGTCSSTIVVRGGVDTTTGYAFYGLLKAASGSQVVTPLTTLLPESGMTNAQLVSLLGLPATVDLTQVDPMAPGNIEILKRTLAVQQIVQQLANFIGTTLTSPLEVQTLYSKAANALAKAALASPNRPLFASDGRVNTTLIGATLRVLNTDTSLPANTLSDTDVTTVAANIVQQSERYMATNADLTQVAKELQNPENPPCETATSRVDYISPKNDSFQINGTPVSLNTFASGITVNGLQTIGLEYAATGAPMINTVVDVEMTLQEKDLGNRILQVKMQQVQVQRDSATGAVTLSMIPNVSAVHVYARDVNKNSFNVSLTNLSFNPITIRNNAVTIDYATLVQKTAGSNYNNSPFPASQFTDIKGHFEVKFVVSSNLNVRHANGDPLPTMQVGIYNTEYGVRGPGIIGDLTIN